MARTALGAEHAATNAKAEKSPNRINNPTRVHKCKPRALVPARGGLDPAKAGRDNPLRQ